MTWQGPMAETSIPVDLLNPGQVFACLGFLEAAEVLLGDAEGAFDWSTGNAARFWLRARGNASPVTTVLEFLAEAEVVAEAPEGSTQHGAWKSAWGHLETRPRHAGYPFPDPRSPATFVCVLRRGSDRVVIDHWGDETCRDNVKFWAGAGGYPGAALAADALELVRDRAAAASTAPFDLGVPQSSSFRLDWRRDYIPIDAGFSLNEHPGRIETVGFPLVELLAAVGLTNARPRRRSKVEYVYGIAGRTTSAELWLPPSMLRASLGAAPLPFAMRHFRMLLGYPGKEGQARAITTVTEETIA